jgi:hypothetical protein
MSRVEATVDPRTERLVVDTENVGLLQFDLTGLTPHGRVRLVLDGKEIGGVAAGLITLGREGVRRAADFRMTFSNRMVWVYGTGGDPEENAAVLAKVRYDAAVWRYRANGAAMIVADRDFDPDGYAGRNVVLYGNADTNSAFAKLRVRGRTVDRKAVTIGDRSFPGDMAGLFTARDGVAVVGATTAWAMRMTGQARYFISGATAPDAVVFGEDVLLVGMEGVAHAAYLSGTDGK